MKKVDLATLSSLKTVFTKWGEEDSAAELQASVNLKDVDILNLVAFKIFVEAQQLEVKLVIKCAAPGCIGNRSISSPEPQIAPAKKVAKSPSKSVPSKKAKK